MSLSPKSIELIKATAPVVAEHAESITSAMYEILFSKHPELKELFKNAQPDQHKKLAAAVVAYASNIDNLGVLSKAIEKMAQTHVRSTVKPEHYPIVGGALLEAISKILGEAATQEILDAWAEAYFFLANILINREKELYTAA